MPDQVAQEEATLEAGHTDRSHPEGVSEDRTSMEFAELEQVVDTKDSSL